VTVGHRFFFFYLNYFFFLIFFLNFLIIFFLFFLKRGDKSATGLGPQKPAQAITGGGEDTRRCWVGLGWTDKTNLGRPWAISTGHVGSLIAAGSNYGQAHSAGRGVLFFRARDGGTAVVVGGVLIGLGIPEDRAPQQNRAFVFNDEKLKKKKG